MGRHRSLFTKTNIEKFARLDLKTQVRNLIISGILGIVLSTTGIVCISLVAGDFGFLLFMPIIWLVISCIFLIVGLLKLPTIKELEEQKRIYNEQLLNSNIESIDTMSGKEFEQFCKLLFEKQGYVVETTKASGDYGVDLILLKDDIKTVGQCKRYNNKISLSAVQEIVAGKNYYNSRNGFIITNNFFTQPAINLAQANSIKLIDRKKLVELICKIKQVNNLEIPDIPKPTQSPITSSHKSYFERYKEHRKFMNYTSDSKNEIVIAYQNSDFNKVKEIIESVESMASNSNDDKITLHFFYQDIANILYAMREIAPTAIDDCIALCDKDIKILKTTKLDTPISITTLSRKAIILEKQNKLEEAIAICDFGIEHNFLDNKNSFSIRKSKLQSKLNKMAKGE